MAGIYWRQYVRNTTPNHWYMRSRNTARIDILVEGRFVVRVEGMCWRRTNPEWDLRKLDGGNHWIYRAISLYEGKVNEGGTCAPVA